MKAITIHGMAPDNSGDTRRAGSTLTVSDELRAGCIDAARAEALVASFAATADGPAGRPKRRAKKKKKPAKRRTK